MRRRKDKLPSFGIAEKLSKAFLSNLPLPTPARFTEIGTFCLFVFDASAHPND